MSDAAPLHRKKHTFRPIVLCHLFGLGAAIPHITFNAFVSSSLVTKRFQEGGTTRARTTQDKKHLSRTYASLVVESVKLYHQNLEIMLTVKSSKMVLIDGFPDPVPILPRVNSRLISRGSPRKMSPLVGWRAAPRPTPFTVRFLHTTPTWRVFSSSEFAFRSWPNIRDINLSIWAHSSPFVSCPEA